MKALSSSLRVMTWNIHKGVGGADRRYDLSRTLAVIQHYAPDVLLLQEVAQNIPSLRYDDQVQLLVDGTGFHHAFVTEHRFTAGSYGNLILSRFPLFDVRHMDLTVGWRKKRGALQAHCRVPVGDHVRSFVVHNLHLGLAGSERGMQLSRLLDSDIVQRLRHDTPALIGGDLNDLWGSLGPRFLLPSGFRRVGSLAATFPSWLPLRPLDGLFTRGDLHVEHFEVCRTQLAKATSDHRPLLAEIVIDWKD